MRYRSPAGVTATVVLAVLLSGGCGAFGDDGPKKRPVPGSSATNDELDGLDHSDDDRGLPSAQDMTDLPDLPSPVEVPASSPAALAPSVLPAPPAGAVNGSDPSALGQAVAVTMWTYDTTVDKSPWDAQLRAAPYLTPEYLDIIRSANPQNGPGSIWLEWKERRAHTRVVAQLADEGGRDPDTPTNAVRTYRLAVTAVAPDGWESQPPEIVVVEVRMERANASAPWRVSEVTPS